jgi:flagellar protein FlaG
MDKIDSLFPGQAAAQASQTPDRAPEPQRPAPRPEREPKRDADTVDIAAIFPSRHIRLVIDEATGIVQAQVRDAATGRVLRKLPDDDWLRESALLREFASQAIVDKSA